VNFSTYLGGSISDDQQGYGADEGFGIAFDNYGCIYVTGSTWCSDFPTLNALDSTYNGNGDVFLTKYSPTGEVLFSTYLGGDGLDVGYSIAVDNSGAVSLAVSQPLLP